MSLTLPNRKPKEMPACVPITNNNVTDVNANMESAAPPGGGSKISKIMTCLFFKKKTEVVDINKESAKKKKMAVDRSERSRRVLQMEQAKEAPTERTGNGDLRPPSAGSHRMFLPSENPTAAFLANLNPNVRRACSDVIRNTNPPASRPPTREAFTDGTRSLVRNTNYRGRQVSVTSGSGGAPSQDKKTKAPGRSQSQTLPGNRKPIVVPGTNVLSEEDFGYNSEHEIGDLTEELKRMKLSQSDVRAINGKRNGRRREGSSQLSSGSLSREGSISLSEGSLSGDEIDNDSVRPPNPSPIQQNPKPVPGSKAPAQPPSANEGRSEKDKKSMENVIDELFMQTQHNIDTIYQNGLDRMDLEVYRAETATPETCMRKLEEDLRLTTESPDAGVDSGERLNAKPTVKSVFQTKQSEDIKMTNGVGDAKHVAGNEGMDSLLNEVSVWAKDRQTWLLDDGKSRKMVTKENTETSGHTDDYAIDDVKMSNNTKCNMWIESQTESESEPLSARSKKSNGILTGPKLFRSSSKNGTRRKVSFSAKGANGPGNGTSNKNNVDVKDLSEDLELNSNSSKRPRAQLPNKENGGSESGLAPWTSDMYNNKGDEDDDRDRSTINDNLSELDRKDTFRARSPDSWLSSVCDYSALLDKRDGSGGRGQNDSFETDRETPLWNGEIQRHTHVQRSATEPARSHQIIRQKPVIHAPFRNIEKHNFNFDGQYNPVSAMVPLMKNTQLRPLPAQRPPRGSQSFAGKLNQNNLPQSLPGLNSNNVLKGSRNMNEFEIFTMGSQAQRPFSEIPVRPDNIRATDGYSAGAVVSPRPNSETIPMKRSEKIGTGHIMATDSNVERQRYARDIVKSMQKQRPEPQTAFGDKIGLEDDTAESKTSKHKRHTVFNNNLLTGGYKYDKHSRASNLNKSDFMSIEQGDPKESLLSPRQRQVNGSEVKTGRATDGKSGVTPMNFDLKVASVSELNLTMKDSRDDRLQENRTDNTDQKIYHSLHGNERFAEALKAQEMAGVRQAGGDQTRMNLTTGIGGRPKGRPVNGVAGSQKGSMNQTAERLRGLKTRRDQEMEWLMQDAAETEV